MTIITLLFYKIATRHCSSSIVINTDISIISWGKKFFYSMEVRSDRSMKLGCYVSDTFPLRSLSLFNLLPSLYNLKRLQSHNTTFVSLFLLCCNSLSIFHHTPLLFPLWKRVYIVCHLPKDFGKSRQGVPVLDL